MSTTEAKTRITDVSIVMVPVADHDRAIDFYVRELGFEKRTDQPYAGTERWVEVAPPGSKATIALTSARGDEWAPGRMTGVILTSDDLEADHAELEARGVDVDPVMPGEDPVPSMFFFRDGDGNTLLLVERQ